MNIFLLHFAIKYKGDWDKIYHALEVKEKVSIETIQELEKTYGHKKWFSILDNEYPNQFKSAFKPPFIVFYEGNLNLLKKNLVTVSMAQEVTSQDKEVIAQSFNEVTKNHIIVNPLKSKQDELNLTAINQNHKPMIIVASTGLDQVKNKNNNLILTEYPDGVKNANHKHDRLTACLSDKLVLLNSNKEIHGKLISAFQNQGKEICCFPEKASEQSYNNELIKDGATLVTKVQDISNCKETTREREV